MKAGEYITIDDLIEGQQDVSNQYKESAERVSESIQILLETIEIQNSEIIKRLDRIEQKQKSAERLRNGSSEHIDKIRMQKTFQEAEKRNW